MMDLEEELEMVRGECQGVQVAARHIASPPLDKLANQRLALRSRDQSQPIRGQASPLDQLLAGSREEPVELAPGLTVSSSLVTPEPITSTILNTIR